MDDKKDIKVSVTLVDNGPVIVKGPFIVIGSDGKPLVLDGVGVDKVVSLCRCGRSLSMPLCDGKHAEG